MSKTALLIAVFGLSVPLLASAARGQQPAPSPADDAARKAEILGSNCWRRAMFELSEWLREQSIYPPEEVARIKRDFSARVEQMSPEELRAVLADLDAKFRILETRESREVRAWLGNYLSVLSDRRRDELLQTIPDFATMTSTQLQQTIDRLGALRDSRSRQRDRMDQLRGSKTNPWSQADTPPRRAPRRAAYHAPYRPPAPQGRPFDDVQVGPTRGMGIDPYGRIWMNLGF
jgi:hypothetical protein